MFVSVSGGLVTYDIPVMKVQNYTIEKIFEKRLLFLIPFYIFSHENRFKDYEKDSVRMEGLKSEYQYIIDTLEELVTIKVITEYTKCTLIDMSKKVLEHIAKDHENVKKEVRSVMGGKVLEYEAKTIKREGIKEGHKKGLIAGHQEGRVFPVWRRPLPQSLNSMCFYSSIGIISYIT